LEIVSDGPRRPPQNSSARDWPGGLTAFEQEMLRGATAGEVVDRNGPFGLEEMQTWGADRSVRAPVLRHLLVAEKWPVHAKGVRLRGLRISEHLNLEAATLRCPLRLENCYLDDLRPVNLDYATVSLVTLMRCHLAGLAGDTLVVTKALDLTGSTLTGPLMLHSADITGQLNCHGAQLTGTDSEGNALIANMMKVGGNVLVDEGFTAAGAVCLNGTVITGSVVCRGARLTGRDSDGNALVADWMKVGGVVFLDEGFTAAGAVRLPGADIGGLNCHGAQLTGTDNHGNALVADWMKVGLDVLLKRSRGQSMFSAAGTLSLRWATVGGSLEIEPYELSRDREQVALDAAGARIISKLRWLPEEQVHGKVNLEGTTVGHLEDCWTEANGGAERPNGYWPTDGRLRLDGFTYNTIVGEQQATVEQRLEWIRSQYQRPGTRTVFATQPYEQLANFYQRAGKDTEARTVAIARRRDLRRYGKLKWHRKALNLLLDVTIGYGYQTWRALAGLVGLYAMVLVISWIAQLHTGLIVPVPQNATGILPKPSALRCMSDYPCFNPFGYAFDTVVPIINLHQVDYLRPNASARPWGAFLVWASWAGTVLGWLAVTLAVAGYTGLARRVNSGNGGS